MDNIYQRIDSSVFSHHQIDTMDQITPAVPLRPHRGRAVMSPGGIFRGAAMIPPT